MKIINRNKIKREKAKILIAQIAQIALIAN